MKATYYLEVKTRKKLYGEYMVLKRLLQKHKADIYKITFEDYLKNIYTLPIQILKEIHDGENTY